jgi:hypothetical protein
MLSPSVPSRLLFWLLVVLPRSLTLLRLLNHRLIATTTTSMVVARAAGLAAVMVMASVMVDAAVDATTTMALMCGHRVPPRGHHGGMVGARLGMVPLVLVFLALPPPTSGQTYQLAQMQAPLQTTSWDPSGLVQALQAILIQQSPAPPDWYMDSDASSHMTIDPSNLTSYFP